MTAEPCFAVSQPSDVVVMENVIRPDTRGTIEQIDAKYELLTRGTYLMNTDPDRLVVRRLDRRVPLELYEARNAVQLSEFAGADRYAAESFQKASRMLRQAENARERDLGRRAIVMPAREAAQTAEDARLIALQRQDDERISKAHAGLGRPRSQRNCDGPIRILGGESWLSPSARLPIAAGSKPKRAADRAVRERASAEAA